jgi:hypothetical protein
MGLIGWDDFNDLIHGRGTSSFGTVAQPIMIVEIKRGKRSGFMSFILAFLSLKKRDKNLLFCTATMPSP